MTLKTAQRLYKHYVDTGQEERAEDIAKHRPEVKNGYPKSKSNSKK